MPKAGERQNMPTAAQPCPQREPEDTGQAGAIDIPAPAWVEHNPDFTPLTVLTTPPECFHPITAAFCEGALLSVRGTAPLSRQD